MGGSGPKQQITVFFGLHIKLGGSLLYGKFKHVGHATDKVQKSLPLTMCNPSKRFILHPPL